MGIGLGVFDFEVIPWAEKDCQGKEGGRKGKETKTAPWEPLESVCGKEIKCQGERGLGVSSFPEAVGVQVFHKEMRDPH